MSYRFESSDFCLQSDRSCPINARKAYEDCLACEGEVLASEVAACDERQGKESRLGCIDEALHRFSERLDACQGAD